MNPEQHTVALGLEEIIRAYLDSFEARDLKRCVGFFAEDAVIHFQTMSYRGRKAIEQWHSDRFEADLRVKCLESIRINLDTVSIDAVVSSKRLAAWMVNQIGGHVTVRFEMGKIKEYRLSARTGPSPVDSTP